jgi:hypothetical protein
MHDGAGAGGQVQRVVAMTDARRFTICTARCPCSACSHHARCGGSSTCRPGRSLNGGSGAPGNGSGSMSSCWWGMSCLWPAFPTRLLAPRSGSRLAGVDLAAQRPGAGCVGRDATSLPLATGLRPVSGPFDHLDDLGTRSLATGKAGASPGIEMRRQTAKDGWFNWALWPRASSSCRDSWQMDSRRSRASRTTY